MIAIGIDSGSRTTKLVLMKNRKLIYKCVKLTGISPRRTVESMLTEAKNTTGDFSDRNIIATGYGRNLIHYKKRKISEISCHARGVTYEYPDTKLIIDIGGQDSKAVFLGEKAKVIDFVMNDRCAAGTGRFLEKVAGILEVDLEDLGKLALTAENLLDINSTCVVFAESEIIGLIARGTKPADIALAVHRSIIRRTISMTAGFPQTAAVAFTGGVAQNQAMVKCLAEEMKIPVLVPSDPFITGALGAALFAGDDLES